MQAALAFALGHKISYSTSYHLMNSENNKFYIYRYESSYRSMGRTPDAIYYKICLLDNISHIIYDSSIKKQWRSDVGSHSTEDSLKTYISKFKAKKPMEILNLMREMVGESIVLVNEPEISVENVIVYRDE
jgi:hypothetical protein